MFTLFSIFAGTYSLEDFILFVVISGIVVPSIAVILGLLFANSKKANKPKRWYFLSIFGALWMLISTLILLSL